MSVVWTATNSIGITKTFADWNLSNVHRTRINQGRDTVTFLGPGLVDDSPVFDYRETVTIKRDLTQFFKGIVISMPRFGTPSDEGVHYELAGPWWYLEKIVYQQTWRLYNSGTGALANVNKSRVILNQDSTGSAINSGDQITAIINYAISVGAPIALGTIDPAVNVPWEELNDITCAEAIIKMLRWSPDAVCYFDYSRPVPVFHCRARSFLDSRTLAFAADDNESLTITPRYDLQIPGITLAYEARTTVNGVTYDKITTDTAGNTSAFDSVFDTVEIAGSSTEILSQSIEVEAWPTLTSKTFWQSRLPWLAAISQDDFTIHTATRTGSLANILKKGTVHTWMGGTASEDTLSALCDYTIKDLSGNTVETVKNRVLKLTVTSTDLVTGPYKRNTVYDQGETIPTGVAAALYSSYGTLQYDGQYTFVDTDVSALRWPNELYPGAVLNITGGLTEWTTMNAVIQQVLENIDYGHTTVVFGPPTHLGADDLVTLLTTFRNRNIPRRFASRTTGISTEAGAVELSGPGPRSEAVDGHGETTSQLIRDTSDSDKQINLAPAALESGEGISKLIQPRVMHIYDPTDKLVKTCQIMATERYGTGSKIEAVPNIESPADGAIQIYDAATGTWISATVTEKTLVTDIQYDSTTKQIQKKTITGGIINPGTETDWTLVTGGQAVEES